jgi:hypothetical protein
LSIFDVDATLGFLHCVDVGSVADVSEVCASSIFRVKVISSDVKMEAACTSKVQETLPTSTWYRHPRAVSSSTASHVKI